jgi:hypothetical protein
MRALVYRNTIHTIPGFVPFHDSQPRGIAYENSTHFVHFFGREADTLWVISPGLAVTQAKSGTLEDWISRTFGADGVRTADCEVGHTIQAVWRPGLSSTQESLQGLDATIYDLRLGEQALLLLIERLDELLRFIEPSPSTLQTYSHKTRELLILACTEVENIWKTYLRIARVPDPRRGDFTTKDYVRLNEPLHLGEFEISLPRYARIEWLRPFAGWLPAESTRSLPWYEAYNKTKHDRSTHFDKASLWACLQAVAANVVLFAVRFGPFHILQGAGTLPALFNQLFSIRLVGCSPSSFYAPALRPPPNQRTDLVCFNATNLVEDRIVDPLQL